MRHTSLVTILVFVAGLGIGYFARSALTATLERKDLAGIEKLHQKDIEVTLSQDPKGLMDIWTEDAVRFNPGSTPAVGKQAIGAENKTVHAQYPVFRVLSYAAKYKTFKSRTAWRASGANTKGNINSLQESRRPASAPKDSMC
jgi:hypothetical protein